MEYCLWGCQYRKPTPSTSLPSEFGGHDTRAKQCRDSDPCWSWICRTASTSLANAAETIEKEKIPLPGPALRIIGKI